MSELIHYSNPQSRGMRTQVLLDAFEIPHRTVVLDFQQGETKTDDYLKIHPYGRVPALVDGDQTIIESGAITLYLADKFPDKLNTPKPGTPERTKLYEWLLFFHATLEPVAVEFFGAKDKEAATAEGQRKVKELLT